MIIRADTTEGIIMLDGVPLHGVFTDISIGGEILLDSSNSGGNGVSRKVMKGYSDKDISLRLTLIPTDEKTVYDQLEDLERLFRDVNSGVPKIFTIVNPHVFARNIQKVLFKSLASNEDNSSERIDVSMTFVEFNAASYQV